MKHKARNTTLDFNKEIKGKRKNYGVNFGDVIYLMQVRKFTKFTQDFHDTR